jgi:hypothetical protein
MLAHLPGIERRHRCAAQGRSRTGVNAREHESALQIKDRRGLAFSHERDPL